MSQWNRKYDGPPARERRQVDQDPIRVPPHKKPKRYRLTVEFETVQVWRRTKEFETKAAMEEAQRRIDKHLRDLAAKEATQKSRYRFYLRRDDPFADYEDERLSRIRTGPTYKQEHLP